MKNLGKSALVLALVSLSAPLFAASPLGKVYCPADYQPTLCTYEGFSAEGGNRCWALVSLESQLKAGGIDYDVKAIQCVKSDVQLLKSSKPACGIVPTTTSCSATVNDVRWTEAATDCDNPIPALKDRLSAAGIDTKGIVVTCEVSQLGRETSYEFTL